MSNLDPRTRLLIGISAVTAVLMSVHAATLMGAGVLLLIIAPLTGQLGRFAKSLRMTLPLTAFVFVVGLIFYDGVIALELALRLFVLFSVSILVFGATGPGEIGDALRLLGFPYALAFMITSGMRYVPLIGLKVRHITEAQRSRGIDLAFKLRNVKNLIALLMPLLFQSFILADDLAVAMESRGFGRKGRSFRKSYRFSPTDWMVTILCLAALAVFLCLERGSGFG
ncbi:MAG: energy-coupling factor transporter transmembrane protein EcfT [Deltaproteobacteria bacterium]|nr:energy-coupling factor transporter transmembrane protein EcfT [Deltaproteobacteria bacterium]